MNKHKTKEAIMWDPEDEDDDDEEPAMEQEQIKDMFPDDYRDPGEDE